MKPGDVVTFLLGKEPNRKTASGPLVKVNLRTVAVRFDNTVIMRKVRRDLGLTREQILDHEEQWKAANV